MIITFPYYDPTGKYNEAFKRQMPTLKSAFGAICLSVVPPTAEENASFARYLEEQGCFMFHNAADAPYGTHSREALRLALEHAQPQQSIFFGFEHRILFALDTHWQGSFLEDLKTWQANECVIFERSRTAWDTHPANFREIEQMVSRMFEFMHGQFIDLMPCAYIFSHSTANVILNHSISASTEVWGEWVLLAIKNGIPMTRREADWLAWKDPYWKHIEPGRLKHMRESSQQETIKRIKMNIPTMLMLTEERFRYLEMSND